MKWVLSLRSLATHAYYLFILLELTGLTFDDISFCKSSCEHRGSLQNQTNLFKIKVGTIIMNVQVIIGKKLHLAELRCHERAS